MTTTSTIDHDPAFGPRCGHWRRQGMHRGYGYGGFGPGGYGPPFAMKAALVIGGFLIFPPLGLAALAWFALRHKFAGHPSFEAWRADRAAAMNAWRAERAADAPSGNAAFEARRKAVLDQIEAERQKLREEAKAFADFTAKEKQDRDQAEYDRYVAEKAKGSAPPKSE